MISFNSWYLSFNFSNLKPMQSFILSLSHHLLIPKIYFPANLNSFGKMLPKNTPLAKWIPIVSHYSFYSRAIVISWQSITSNTNAKDMPTFQSDHTDNCLSSFWFIIDRFSQTVVNHLKRDAWLSSYTYSLWSETTMDHNTQIIALFSQTTRSKRQIVQRTGILWQLSIASFNSF